MKDDRNGDETTAKGRKNNAATTDKQERIGWRTIDEG
jgi:hypothetical protein